MNSIPTDVQLQIYDFYLSRIKYEHERKIEYVSQMLHKDIKRLVHHGHLEKIGTKIPFDWNDVQVNDTRLPMFRKRYNLLKDYCDYIDITKWRIRIPTIEMVMESKKISKKMKKNQQQEQQQQDGDTIDVYLIYIDIDDSERSYRKQTHPSKEWKGFFDVRTYQQLAISCHRFNPFNEMKSQPMEKIIIPLIEMYAEFLESGGYDEEYVEELVSQRDELLEQEYHHELHSFSEFEELRSLILQSIKPNEN